MCYLIVAPVRTITDNYNFSECGLNSWHWLFLLKITYVQKDGCPTYVVVLLPAIFQQGGTPMIIALFGIFSCAQAHDDFSSNRHL